MVPVRPRSFSSRVTEQVAGAGTPGSTRRAVVTTRAFRVMQCQDQAVSKPQILANSSGLSEAPPTRAPSTSSLAMISATLEDLTEPP